MAQVIPTIRFSVYRGAELIGEHTFQRDVINIGKLSRSHLRLDDDNISRMHAVVEVTRTGEVDIADLGSTNGTFLNGEKISRARLRDGDEVSLGGTRLVVQIALPQAETTAPAKGAGTGRKAPKAPRRRKLPPALNPDVYLEQKPIDEGTGKFGLEIGVFLGESLMDVRHFRTPTTVTVGEDLRSSYKVPQEILTTGRYELVKPQGNGFALNIGLEAFGGAVHAGGRTMALAEARSSGVAPGGMLPLDQDTRAKLELGNLTFLIGYQPLPKRPKVGLLRQINVQEQIYLALSVILHLAFLILLSLIPEEQLRATKDPRKEKSSLIQAIQVAEQEKKKEEEEEAKEEEKKIPDFEVEDKEMKVEVAEEETPAPPIEVEKKEKKPDQSLTSKLTPKEVKERNKQIVQNAGLNKVLNQTDLLANVMGGTNQYLGDAKKGMKILGSNAAGENYDSGSMNPFGGELAQGGPGGTGGFAGNLSTLGGGTGGPGGGGMVAGLGKEAAGGDRKVNVAFKDTTQKIKVTVADVSVSGELDKATVRRVIQSYLGQIKWCYQKELQKNPDLGGKVVLSFLIAANGSTVNPKVSLNTMSTPEVGSCIAQKATRWKFPSPRNGGVVKVSYPFLFKSK